MSCPGTAPLADEFLRQRASVALLGRLCSSASPAWRRGLGRRSPGWPLSCRPLVQCWRGRLLRGCSSLLRWPRRLKRIASSFQRGERRQEALAGESGLEPEAPVHGGDSDS